MAESKKRSTSYTVSAKAAQLLENIADYHGISKTAVIEMIARQEARKLGLE